MEDLMTKRKIDGDDMAEEEQSWPKKPTLVKPLPLRAELKLPFGSGSSFKPWKRPIGDINNGHNGIDAEVKLTSSNINKPCHRLAKSSNSTDLVEDHGNNDMNIENCSTEMNPIFDIGANSGDDDANNDDDNTDITDHEVIEVPEDQPSSGGNNKSEMDPKKLRRIMANRLSAQRSRDTRNAYVADLEHKAKAYQEKIAFLHPQIAAQNTQVQSLQIEQHRLKLLMTAREKQRILQEAAIEKNRAEADRLRKLNMKLTAEAQARMLINMGAAFQIRSDSNLFSSGLGRFLCNNSPQALNGVRTSMTQVDTAQQPQNQSQMMMMMPTWENRLKSIPNLNLVKSEPES